MNNVKTNRQRIMQNLAELSDDDFVIFLCCAVGPGCSTCLECPAKTPCGMGGKNAVIDWLNEDASS